MKNKIKSLLNKKNLRNFLYINIGVFAMAFSFSVFLDPNQLVIGGALGLSTLLKDVFLDKFNLELSSSYFYFGFNVICLILALIFLGKKFFVATIYASVISPVYTYLIEILYKQVLTKNINIPNIAELCQEIGGDKGQIVCSGAYLLVIIFSAVLCGIGLGFALKYGASTGGTDILQAIMFKYFKIPYSLGIAIVDGLIVLLAGVYFKSFYHILYGALFIFISGYVTDSIVFSGFNVRAVYIITTKPQEVKKAIYKAIGRGVTESFTRGGFTQDDQVSLICVMSSSEFFKIRAIITSIDSKAFIYAMRASEVHGEGFSYESESITEFEPRR